MFILIIIVLKRKKPVASATGFSIPLNYYILFSRLIDTTGLLTTSFELQVTPPISI